MSVSTRDSSSAAPPQSPPAAHAGPQRALLSRLARAPSPPARAPRPGLGWSRACSSQGGSWAPELWLQRAAGRGSRRATHLPPLGPPGTSRRSPYQSGPSRHHRPWPGLHLRLLCARDRGTPALSRVSKSSASRGSVVPMVQGKGRAGAQVTV